MRNSIFKSDPIRSLERVRLNQKLLETIVRIIKEHSLVQRSARRRAEERVVSFFGDIQGAYGVRLKD